MGKSEEFLNISQAAEFLDISVSWLYQLIGMGRIGCFGKKNQHKRFSIEKHLMPYLESIETKAFQPSGEYEIPIRDYEFQTEIFSELFN